MLRQIWLTHCPGDILEYMVPTVDKVKTQKTAALHLSIVMNTLPFRSPYNLKSLRLTGSIAPKATSS